MSVCAHCGLRAPSGASFCCFGCELAHRLGAEASTDGARSMRASVLLAAFLTMNLMTFSLYLYGEDVYGPSWDAMRALFRWVSGAIALPIYVILGGPIARSAWSALRRRALSAELLVSIAAAAAILASYAALFTGRGAVYFETACMVLLLTMIGRFLEAMARATAGGALAKRLRLGRETATRIDGEREREVPIAELVEGDLVRVAIGRSVPADGVVASEGARVSTAVLDGEPAARAIAKGASVPAGAIVERSPLEVRITAPARSSTIERLARVIEGARTRRAEVERLADRMAAVLIPGVAALALVTFVVVARRLSTEAAIVRALAVVLVACPCSFGLAVPLVFARALDRAAERGVIVRGADVLERAARVRRVVFDKTGTLTRADLRVANVDAHDGTSTEEVLALAAAIERDVDHPIARAIVREAKARSIEVPRASGVALIEGGVRGTVDGRAIVVSRGADRRALVVRREGRAMGTLDVHEHVRSEAPDAIAALKALGVGLEIATGDRSTRGPALGRSLGVDVAHGLDPADKLARVESLDREGDVAMVGDGYNDAPALARASVGVALGSGVDASQGVAGVCVVDSDLRKIPWFFSLARRARAIALQNLAWALVYNGAFLALAVAGKLVPTLAAISMVGSSMAVLLNSLRVGGRAPRATKVAEA